MSTWMQVVITTCVVAVTIALIPMVITLRRSLYRAQSVLQMLEEQIGPLAGQLQPLIEDLRMLARQSNRELERLGAMADRVSDLSERAGRIVGFLGGFTRIGQVVGVAAGLKKGVDVFVNRIRKHGGHNDG